MHIRFRILLFFLIPCVLLPLLLVKKDSRLQCIYILVIMASFWFLDILPYGITSILPVLLAPMMSLETSGNMSAQYATDSLLLCLGRLIMACAFQQQQVHRRFGLFLLNLFGPQPRYIILSCMIPSYILTMFISNTATAPIMLEFAIEIVNIIKSIEEGIEVNPNLDEVITYGAIERNGPLRSSKVSIPPNWEDEYTSMVSTASPSISHHINRPQTHITIPEIQDINPSPTSSSTQLNFKLNMKRFCPALYISTGYAASCGAVATIVACGPNLVLYELVQRRYGSMSGLNYGTFIAIGLPMSIVSLFLTWLWVGIFHMRPKAFLQKRQNTENEERFARQVKQLKEEMGPISFSQWSCIGLTAAVIVLWITRQFGSTGGWGHAFMKDGHITVTDATPMILIIALFYIWPSRPKFWVNDESDSGGSERLLTWESTHKNLPWSIIFLLGAGFAISHMCEVSQLKDWISLHLSKGLADIQSPYAIIILACLLSCISTEFLSSTSALPIYLTIFMDLAKLRNENPFYYLFPLTFSASYAFCLPAATTPNIAIFNRKLATGFQLLKTGILMDLVFIAIIFVFTIALVPHIFTALNPTNSTVY